MVPLSRERFHGSAGTKDRSLWRPRLAVCSMQHMKKDLDPEVRSLKVDVSRHSLIAKANVERFLDSAAKALMCP